MSFEIIFAYYTKSREPIWYNNGMNVLITGASSGIGEALAQECAKRGDRLFLCGRNHERLNAVQLKCRDLGAKAVYAEAVDVTDEDAVRDWILRCEAIAPLERIFSNAGVGTGIEDEANVRRTWSTNVGGNLNVVLPVLDLFRNGTERRRRQILVTASIAGYGPLATCPAYSGSKAAMKTWALALRGMLKKEGIEVSAICPGFVRSRITDRNTCPMPFFMEADKAARIILARADRNVGMIAFPWPMRLATWWLSTLPFRLNELINALLPAKTAKTAPTPF